MRTHNISGAVVLMAAMVILISCRKTDAGPMNTEPLKLTSVLKMSGDEQLTAFNMLSPSEKVAVRKLHINKYQARKHFNDTQTAMINEFLEFNKPGYYAAGSDEREYAITFFAKDWLQRAVGTFKNHELYTLVFSLDDIELRMPAKWDKLPVVAPVADESKRQLNPDRSPYNNESLPNCFCSVGSSFTCPEFGFKYNPTTKSSEISVQYGSCTYAYTSPCDVEGGCGFGGWSTCDGNRCS